MTSKIYDSLRVALEGLLFDGMTIMSGGSLGLATLCIGVGQGLAVAVERI